MRLPRLKLRTLIVLVAVATLAVGAVEYRRRVARYQELAAREAQAEGRARLQERNALVSVRRHRELSAKKRQDRERLTSLVMNHVAEPRRREELKEHVSAALAVSVQQSDADLDRSVSLATYWAHKAERHARRRAAFLRCARYPWLSPPADELQPR